MAQARGFTPDQVARYARHLILPEVGGAGQRKLLSSSVLLLGAGGLGSPASMYLAAAGVGKIGIVDFDTVDASNLQRQLLHGTKDTGRLKAESAPATRRPLPRQASRARQHPPVRGTPGDVRFRQGHRLLPLPFPRAPSARRGAELR